MELLSALSLGELALSFSRVPLFPVFDLSYFIVSILYLKYEPGEPGRRVGGAGIAGRGRGGGSPGSWRVTGDVRGAGRCWDHGVPHTGVAGPWRNVREGKGMSGLGEGKQTGPGGQGRTWEQMLGSLQGEEVRGSSR